MNLSSQLLKPYRALAENWELEIEEDLLEYLARLELVGSSSSYLDLNFAQAAMLIQNSALVYGKKVDLLYEFVFKTLEALSLSYSDKPVSSKLSRKSSTTTTEPSLSIEVQNSAFAPLDELVQFSSPISNVTHLERQCNQQVGLIKTLFSTKLANGEFNISALSICPESGLLQLEQAVVEEVGLSIQEDSPMMEDYDNDDFGGDFGGDDPFVEAVALEQQQQQQQKEEKKPASLDPHLPSNTRKDKPFQRGKVFTLPLPNPPSFLPQERFVMDAENDEPESVLQWIGYQPCVNQRGKSKLYFPEFEQLLAMRRKQHKIVIIEEEGEEETYSPPEDYDYAGGDDNGDDYDDDSGDNEKAPFAVTALTEEQDVTMSSEDHDAHLVQLSTYTEVVRSHVNRFLEDCRNWAQESRLLVRVHHWHLYLEPILEREAQRPVFDLKHSQTELLESFPKSCSMGRGCSFDLLSSSFHHDYTGQVETWQVCRMFLTTLVLANAGEVEIQDSGVCPTERAFQLQDSFQVSKSAIAAPFSSSTATSSALRKRSNNKRVRLSLMGMEGDLDKENVY
ncbi:hypothetical protein BASA81_012726 [Batrachochytrium salamandrivorans]|nr:hypothetical protein BASA81_012726 [Batrachochytrium salamandrivorans]